MNTLFSDTFKEQAKKFTDPLQAINRAWVSNLERVTEYSLTTARNYAELGLKQLHAASAVKDPETLTSFQSQQTQLLSELSQMLLKDAERLTEIGNQLRSDLSSVMGQSYQQAAQPAAAAEAKASKATAKA